MIARIIRELVARERFEEYADFKHALRRRLLALRIGYAPSTFDDAITSVTSNTELWGDRA